MAFFVGEFDQAMDAKRRLAIPAALREQIDTDVDGDNFFLVLGSGMHLWLYPDKYYRTLMATIKRSPFPTPQTARLGLFYAMARFIKPDKQGRIVLPEKSLARACVDTQLTLVGNDDHIELWPKDKWDSHVDQHLSDYEKSLADMAGEFYGSPESEPQ